MRPRKRRRPLKSSTNPRRSNIGKRKAMLTSPLNNLAVAWALGVDVVLKVRVERILKLHPDFYLRVLSEPEVARFEKLKNIKRRAEFLAGRWAVKEAGFKAFYLAVKQGGYRSSDEVLRLARRFSRWRFEENGILKLELGEGRELTFRASISHERCIAVGVALGPVRGFEPRRGRVVVLSEDFGGTCISKTLEALNGLELDVLMVKERLPYPDESFQLLLLTPGGGLELLVRWGAWIYRASQLGVPVFVLLTGENKELELSLRQVMPEVRLVSCEDIGLGLKDLTRKG